MTNNNWVPEIMYEESEEGANNIPFIQVLRPELFDEVRVALGLQPLAEAVTAGQKITQNVRNSLE